MRSISFIFMLILALGCASRKNTNMESSKLNGTWVPIQQEMGGTVLPAPAFEKQSLIFSDSTYTLTAESVDKGTVKYQDGKMDIHSKEGPNAGKHIPAIYKLENNQLTICYNLAGGNYPEAFDTKGKPMYFLAVFRKQ